MNNYINELVINCLSRGKVNAVKQDYIKAKTGLNKRDIRYIVQELRHQGYPICSTTYDGYWLADCEEDLEHCISQLTAQAITLHDTIAALTDTKIKLFGE